MGSTVTVQNTRVTHEICRGHNDDSLMMILVGVDLGLREKSKKHVHLNELERCAVNQMNIHICIRTFFFQTFWGLICAKIEDFLKACQRL